MLVIHVTLNPVSSLALCDIIRTKNTELTEKKSVLIIPSPSAFPSILNLLMMHQS
jgi:hypothetical protein